MEIDEEMTLKIQSKINSLMKESDLFSMSPPNGDHEETDENKWKKKYQELYQLRMTKPEQLLLEKNNLKALLDITFKEMTISRD